MGSRHSHVEDRQRHAEPRGRQAHRLRPDPVMGRIPPRDRRTGRNTRLHRLRVGLLHRRYLEGGHARHAEGRARQDRREDRRHHQRQDRCALCRQGHGADRRREAAGLAGRGRARRRHHAALHRGRGLGHRRLCAGQPLQADGPEGQAHAVARHGPCLVRHRPRPAHARPIAGDTRPDEAAHETHRAGEDRQSRRRRGGLRHGCGGGRRHSQSHALRSAGAGEILL